MISTHACQNNILSKESGKAKDILSQRHRTYIYSHVLTGQGKIPEQTQSISENYGSHHYFSCNIQEPVENSSVHYSFKPKKCYCLFGSMV